ALTAALEPAAEVEGTPSHALSDALGHQRLHASFGVEFGSGDPHPLAVLDAALGSVCRINLDVHVLLQLSEPLVGARLFTPAFVFDDAARGEYQRERLGDALVHRRLLHI